MSEYLLDSDVLISYLRGYKRAVQAISHLDDAGHDLCCCTVSVTEVYAGMRKEEEQITTELLESLIIYEADFKIARLAGEYLRGYRHQNVTLSLPDATIAATAILYGLPLLTFNTGHYPMPEIRLHRPTIQV